MKGYVYILNSEKIGQYYIGSSQDVDARLFTHNAGKTKSTKKGIPWKIVFRQQFNTIKEARQIEYRLKRKKSRIILEKIITDGKITFGE